MEASADKPALWLCGHIHEGRGAIRKVFTSKNSRPGQRDVDTTYVVNAATANEGKARVLVSGPVVIDLVDAADEAVPQDWTSPTGSASDPPLRLMRPDSLDALALAERGDDVDRRSDTLVPFGGRPRTAHWHGLF